MRKFTRSFPTFEDIMEVVEAIMKSNPISRIYLETEIVEAANEAGLEEFKEKGTNKTPIFITKEHQKGSLLSSIIMDGKEKKFDIESEPYWECCLTME